MTLRLLALSLALAAVLAGCGTDSDASNAMPPEKLLEKYRAERAKLDEKIKELEQKTGSKSQDRQGVPVTVITTAIAPFEHVIMVQGTVDSRSSVVVSPKASGQITALHVTNGQAVRQGQLLMELDAELIVRGIEEVNTQLDFANTLYEKQKRIYDQKAGSEIQYLQAKNTKESLEKRLASLQEQLAMTKVKAPTSGFVDGLKPTAGEMVMAGMPVMTIVNTSDMRVIADIAETYASSVGVGDPVAILFPDVNQTVQTKVTTVSREVNPVNRTFRVEIPIRPAPATLRPNTTCELKINDITVPQTISIPLEAVVREGERTYAYVIADNVAQKRQVETGLVTGDRVQVIAGIGADERVVVRGSTTLADGQKVRVIE